MKEVDAALRHREQVRLKVEATRKAVQTSMKRSQQGQRAAAEALQKVRSSLQALEEIRRRRSRPSDDSSLVG
jgi:hypothetical protein